LVDSVESMMMHGLANPKFINFLSLLSKNKNKKSHAFLKTSSFVYILNVKE
jgi:hypothetical protein